jgi:ubiquinone biosynthesis protein COQ4
MTMPKKRIRPIAAIKALRALLKNPEDTKQVFLVIKALNGNAGARDFERFRRSEVGQAVLRERRVLLNYLCDRERLSKLPTGTLGRDYYEFMSQEGLTADGLVGASKISAANPSSEGVRHFPPAEDDRLFAERGRDCHDLQHALTGYGRDELGEVCVLAFSSARDWNPGLLLIAIGGMFKVSKDLRGHPVKRTVWEAWRNGRKAAWLTGLDWEGLLPRQLGEIRSELNVRPPVLYHRVMASLAKSAPGNGEDEAPALAVG